MERLCTVCDADISDKTKRAMYCGTICKQTARRDRIKAEIHAGRQRLCKHCRKPVLITRTLKAVYCSDACGNKHENGFGPYLRLKKYGLSLSDIAEMAKGGCHICGVMEPGGRWNAWHIDHDHSCCNTDYKTCGKCIRGLLCGGCNRGLGQFNDDPARLRAAADYIESWASREAA